MAKITIGIEENQEKREISFNSYDKAIAYLVENKPKDSLTDRRTEALHD